MKRFMKKIFAVALLTAAVVACDSNETVEVTGVFEATEVVVSNEIPGKLVSFVVEEGDSLWRNEQVGIIDTMQLYLSKLQLVKSASSIRSSMPEIAKQVASLQSQIDKQKYEKARVERLVASNAATRKQLDDINSAIRVLESQLAASESTLNNNFRSLEEQGSAVDVQIEQIEDRLAKCRVSAPIDGIVLDKYAEAGEYASTGQPLFKMADLRNMYLRAYVTAAGLAKVKLGQKITVINDADGKEYEGRVTWIADKAEFTPKNIQSDDERQNLVYAIKIKVVNDGWLKIGMYGKIML